MSAYLGNRYVFVRTDLCERVRGEGRAAHDAFVMHHVRVRHTAAATTSHRRHYHAQAITLGIPCL